MTVLGPQIKAQLEVHKKLMKAKKHPFRRDDVLPALPDRAPFVDIFYQPTNYSVGVEEASSNLIQWRRPLDFLRFEPGTASSVEVFDMGIQANDISQGELGNCWFMCSLGALCEFPLLVDRLFVQAWNKDEASVVNRASAEGMYELRFCTSGVWRTLVIDDHFPCKRFNDGIGPVFSRSKGNECAARNRPPPPAIARRRPPPPAAARRRPPARRRRRAYREATCSYHERRG